MYTGVPTIYSAAIQVAQRRGSPHDVYEHSTIHEVLDKIPEATLAGQRGQWVAAPYSYQDTRQIKVCCVCIGHGGHRLRAESGALIPTFEPRPHRATDSGLFKQMPFVVKPVNADLSAADRERFCLRRTMMINGVLHAAYFGRVVNETEIPNATIVKRIITDSSDVSTEWRPSSADNSPSMKDDEPAGTTQQVYVSAAVVDQLTFTEQDVTWLREACRLLYGSESYAYISEVAVCTGVKREVTARYNDSGNASSAYTGPMEYVGVQVASFSYAACDMSAHPTGFNMGISTAVSEPLMGRED